MALYAGPAAGLVHEVLQAAEIVQRIAAEADEAWARLAATRGGDGDAAEHSQLRSL
jgi:hypothetical protein